MHLHEHIELEKHVKRQATLEKIVTAPLTKFELDTLSKTLSKTQLSSLSKYATLTEVLLDATRITDGQAAISQLKIGFIDPYFFSESKELTTAINKFQSLVFAEDGKFIGIKTRQQQIHASWIAAEFIQKAFPKQISEKIIHQLSEQNDIKILVRPQRPPKKILSQEKIINNSYNTDLLNSLRFCENQQFDQVLPLIQKYWNLAETFPHDSQAYLENIRNGTDLFDYFQGYVGTTQDATGIIYRTMLDPLWQDFYNCPTIYQVKVTDQQQLHDFRGLLEHRQHLKDKILQSAGLDHNSFHSYLAYRIIDNSYEPLFTALRSDQHPASIESIHAFHKILPKAKDNNLDLLKLLGERIAPIRAYKFSTSQPATAYFSSVSRETVDVGVQSGRLLEWMSSGREARKTTFNRNSIITDHINNFRTQELKYQIRLLEHDRITIQETLKQEYAPLRYEMSRTPVLYADDQYRKFLINWPEGRQMIMALYNNLQVHPNSDVTLALKEFNLANLFTILAENYMRSDLIHTVAGTQKQLLHTLSNDQVMHYAKNYYYNRSAIEQFFQQNPYKLDEADKAAYLLGILPEECQMDENVSTLLTQFGVNKFEFFQKLHKGSLTTHKSIVNTLSEAAALQKQCNRSNGTVHAVAKSVIETARKSNTLNRDGKTEAAEKVIYFASQALRCTEHFAKGVVHGFTSFFDPKTWKDLGEFSLFATQYFIENAQALDFQERAIELQLFENIVSLSCNSTPETTRFINEFTQFADDYSESVATKHAEIKEAFIKKLITEAQQITPESAAQFAGEFLGSGAAFKSTIYALKTLGLAARQFELGSKISAAFGRINRPGLLIESLEGMGMPAQYLEQFETIANTVAQETVVATGQVGRTAKAVAQCPALIEATQKLVGQTKSEKLYFLLSADKIKRAQKIENALLKSRKTAINDFTRTLIGEQSGTALESTVKKALAEFADTLTLPKCTPHGLQIRKKCHAITFDELKGLTTDVKDWEKLAKAFDRTHKIPSTDVAIYTDFEHIFNPIAKVECATGEITFSGFHHDYNGLLENSGYLEIINRKEFGNGFYRFEWRVKGSNAKFKESSFFPQTWTRPEIIENISSSIKKIKESPIIEKNRYILEGVIKGGHPLQIIIEHNGELISAYPLLK